jgi:hypothetical protein
LPAAIATCLLIGFSSTAQHATVPIDADTACSDPRWRLGKRYALLCATVPVILLANTALSLAIQNPDHGETGRLRFGPKAYWRQTARLQGTWQAIGLAKDLETAPYQTVDLPLARIEFDAHRNAASTNPAGQRIAQHRWFLKNQYIWLHWFAKSPDPRLRAEIPLHFQFARLYIAWPPDQKDQGYLVLERSLNQHP